MFWRDLHVIQIKRGTIQPPKKPISKIPYISRDHAPSPGKNRQAVPAGRRIGQLGKHTLLTEAVILERVQEFKAKI